MPRLPGRPRTRTTDAKMIAFLPPSDDFLKRFNGAKLEGETNTAAAVRLINKGIDNK